MPRRAQRPRDKAVQPVEERRVPRWFRGQFPAVRHRPRELRVAPGGPSRKDGADQWEGPR